MKKTLLCLLLSSCPFLYSYTHEEILSGSAFEIFDSYKANDPALASYLKTFSLDNYDVVVSPALGNFLVDKNNTDMIKQVIKEGWYREGHLFFPLAEHIRDGSIAIDIGGHIGTHTVGLSHRLNEGGTVHVFEPQLKLFSELVLNLELNRRSNVICHRQAVGCSSGFVEMNPPSPGNEGGVSVGRGGDPVEMVRLDDFGLKNVSIIKIDVEGLEMEVLEGAKKTIEENRPVIAIEILGHASYDSASPEHKKMVEERIAVIEAMGYQVRFLGMADFLCVPLR